LRWSGWICYDLLQHWRWHSSINRLPHSSGADDAYALARTGRVGIRVPVQVMTVTKGTGPCGNRYSSFH
jgi:hypothetical protein